MDAVHFLKQYRKADRLIRMKTEEYERLYSSAFSTAGIGFGEKVQSSPSQQKMAMTLDHCVDLEREIKPAIAELKKQKHEIVQTIEQLPENEFEVLFKKYVLYMEYYDIADSMDKSLSWVMKTRKRGIRDLQKVLDERGTR